MLADVHHLTVNEKEWILIDSNILNKPLYYYLSHFKLILVMFR
jgi:hypothetical protein